MSDEKIILECVKCQEEYEIEVTEDWERQAVMLATPICPECSLQAQEDAKKSELERKHAEFLAGLPERYERSGLPLYYRVDKVTDEEITTPFKPLIVEFFRRFVNRNLLITGATGSGKSTSAVFVACELVRSNKQVRYCKLCQLLNEWRISRTSEYQFSDERFFNIIKNLDLLIIDECAGKTKNTATGCEMMFELLDRINTGQFYNTKVWMLGNLYKDCFVDIFGENEPVRRRIQENFICGKINGNEVQPFSVWHK